LPARRAGCAACSSAFGRQRKRSCARLRDTGLFPVRQGPATEEGARLVEVTRNLRLEGIEGRETLLITQLVQEVHAQLPAIEIRLHIEEVYFQRGTQHLFHRRLDAKVGHTTEPL